MATVEEIYSNISAHMVKGLMIHDQMASYYYFLNLEGYGKCHEYHYWEESKNYLCLKKYYFKHHEKLIKEKSIENPQIIPSSWINYTKEQVDINTKRSSVKSGLEKWVNWEEETKKLYEKSYADLIAIGCVGDALFISKFLKDVDCELAHIKKCYIKLQDCDFSIESIIGDQKCKKEKYKEKMKGINEG